MQIQGKIVFPPRQNSGAFYEKNYYLCFNRPNAHTIFMFTALTI